MTTVGELVAVLRADSAQFVASMEEAQTQVGALKAETTGFSKTASTAFIAAGAVAVIAIAKMVDATVEWARSVKSLQNTTGQTAESASQLLVVGQDFGLSVTQMTTAFGIFEKNIVSGNKNIAKFGLATRDAQGNLLPFDQLLSNAADTYVSLRTQTEKTAFAQLVFGRSGRALIPILKQGAAGLAELRAEAEKSNLVIGQGTVDAAVNLGISERKLGEAFHGVAVSIGTEFLPVAAKVINWLVTAVQWVGNISPAIPAVALGLTAVAGAGALLIRVGQGVVGAFTSLFGATSAEVAATTEATGATVTLTGALTDLIATLQAEFDTEVAAVGSTTALADAKAAAVAPTEALAAANKDLDLSSGGAEIAAVGAAGALTTVGLVASTLVVPLAALVMRYKALRQEQAAYARSVAADKTLLDMGGAPAKAVRDLAKLSAAAIAAKAAAARGAIPQSFVDSGGRLAAGAEATGLAGVQQQVDIAKQALEDYRHEQKLLGQSSEQTAHSLQGVFAAVADATTPIAQVADATTLLNKGIDDMSGAFTRFSQVSGQDASSMLANLQKVVNDPASTVEQVSAAYTTTLGQMQAANKAWHDSLVSTFGGAGSAMDNFANKQNIDITKAIGDLQAYTAKIHSFDGDINTINKEFGKKAADFIQWASQQGLAQAGLVHAVATANHKNANDFITQWGRAKSATDQLANDIQAALAPMFNKIIHWLKSVVNAVNGIPPIDMKTQKAMQDLHTFDNNVDTLLSKKRVMNIIVHTSPGSPWPDEALKQHLTDPIQRAGFKKINGRWTLPLDVGVHSSLSPQGQGSDLWKRQAEDAATSIVALTNRSGSTPREGMGIVRRVSQMGSDAAYIKSVAAGVGSELNAAQAHHFTQALQLLDKRTMDSGMRSDAAIQAALGKMNHLLDNTAAGSASTPASPALWRTQAFAKNVPYLPPMHTNLHEAPRHHHRGPSLRVILDRRHMDEQETYQEDYGRGY